MYKNKITLLVLILILLLASCVKKGTTTDDSVAPNNSGASNGGTEGEKNEKKPTVLADFFLPDGSTAHYKGEGNEFAELDVQIARPFENYVITHENNGGSMVRSIYHITAERIDILEDNLIDTTDNFPTIDELEKMKPVGIYLEMPFEKGKVFSTWTIVETDITVETPFQRFDHAIVIEHVEEGFTNRKYFVEGYGEVKRESIMKMEGEKDFIVTSTLEAVDK